MDAAESIANGDAAGDAEVTVKLEAEGGTGKSCLQRSRPMSKIGTVVFSSNS